MNNEIIYVTTDPLTPTAIDILKSAAREVYGDKPVRLRPAGFGEESTALGFGLDAGVRTLSPKQIMAFSHARSSLVEALTLYRNGNTLPEPVIIDVPDDLANSYLGALAPYYDKPVVFDIENAPDGRILSISITVNDVQCFVFTSDLLHVAEFLATCYYTVAHNGKSDQVKLRDAYGIKVPIWFDTLLARHTLHPSAQGHYSLKELGMRVLGIPDWESDIKQFTGTGDNADYSKIPHERLVPYNGMDTYTTWHLFKRWLPLVQDNPAFWHEMSAADMLGDVEYGQISVDTEYLKVLSAELLDDMTPLLEQLRSVTHEKFNPNSPAQVKAALEDRNVLTASTDAKHLDEISSHGLALDLIEPLLAYRKVSKLRSTYAEALLKAAGGTGKVRTNFNVFGTSTGRLSSSNPNLQNQPRDKRIRNIYLGEPWFVNADFSQAELRTMAVLSGDTKMQAFFQPGMPDYFDSVMTLAYPDQFSTLDEFEQFKQDDPVEAKELRIKLKTVIFGLAFGRQATAIAAALKVTPDYAQGIIDNYLVGLPDFNAWRQEVTEAALNESKRDFLVTRFGRFFECEVITKRNRQNVINAALAFLPQSTASDLCLTGAIRANRRIKREDINGRIVGLVHDAIMGVAYDEDSAKYLCEVFSEEMSGAAAEYMGTEVPYAVEAAYAERWGKVEG